MVPNESGFRLVRTQTRVKPSPGKPRWASTTRRASSSISDPKKTVLAPRPRLDPLRDFGPEKNGGAPKAPRGRSVSHGWECQPFGN